MKSLSDRTQNIAASLTVAIDTMAKQMIADGKDVVSLGAGEPDFGTPTPIQDAAIEAIRAGKTRYTAPVGILEVRKAVAKKLEEENGLHYDASQIIMTSGAKHAVFNALAALINPGDEVIIPAPYWVTYPELVKWLGGTPVFVQAGIEKNFKIDAEDLRKACTPRTKAILLNNPCNPTGAVYSKSELEALAKEIVAQDIYCISDEVYEYFVYDTEFTSAAVFPGMAERTIVINGFSKSHCMTGWRIGYDAAPPPRLQRLSAKFRDRPPTTRAMWRNTPLLEPSTWTRAMFTPCRPHSASAEPTCSNAPRSFRQSHAHPKAHSTCSRP